jgi:hypothetical protein
MALYGHSRHDLKKKEAYSCMVTHGMLLMHDTNTRRHDLNINTHGMLFTQGRKTRQILTACTTNSKKQAYLCMVEILTQEGKAKQG